MARLSWHLTQYFVIRRGIVAKILCPECTTHCGLHTPQYMWRIWIIGCCRDKSTRRVYFAINGLMSRWMYTSSTHIVVEDAAVGRVILGGQQVDGEECRHSPSAWSGWHQSLISISKIIRKRRLTFECEDNYRRWGRRCLCCHERELRREMLEKFSIGP